MCPTDSSAGVCRPPTRPPTSGPNKTTCWKHKHREIIFNKCSVKVLIDVSTMSESVDELLSCFTLVS